MKRKRFVLPILLVLAVCAGSLLLVPKAKQTDDAPTMNMDYRQDENGVGYWRYHGDAQEFLDIVDPQNDVIEVSVKRISGELQIKIYEVADEQNVLYEGHDFPAERFTVKAGKPGYYRIWIHATNFCGSYDFDYSLR